MQPDSCAIRPAQPDDLAALPAIERAAAALFHNTPYPAMADAPLASEHLDLAHDAVWVVLDHQNCPMGFAIVQSHESAVHLRELDVDPRHARQGLGRRLIEAIADWAQAKGATALTLTTFSDVPWNGPYYVRLGFRALDACERSPALQAVWQAEENAGLPMANRVCMQRDL